MSTYRDTIVWRNCGINVFVKAVGVCRNKERSKIANVTTTLSRTVEIQSHNWSVVERQKRSDTDVMSYETLRKAVEHTLFGQQQRATHNEYLLGDSSRTRSRYRWCKFHWEFEKKNLVLNGGNGISPRERWTGAERRLTRFIW